MRIFPARWLACGLLMASGAQANPQFVDARDHPDPAAGRERFLAAERLLVRGFDDICGDTFCEGQYYNLRPMRLRCSVHRASGVVGSCIWTFAGSYTRVQQTGQIDVDHGTYALRAPACTGNPSGRAAGCVGCSNRVRSPACDAARHPDPHL